MMFWSIVLGYVVLLVVAGVVGYFWGVRPEKEVDWRTVYVPPVEGEGEKKAAPAPVFEVPFGGTHLNG